MGFSNQMQLHIEWSVYYYPQTPAIILKLVNQFRMVLMLTINIWTHQFCKLVTLWTLLQCPTVYPLVAQVHATFSASNALPITFLCTYLYILLSANNHCDWNCGNHFKSHIGSYEIIDLKHYNQPRIVSMWTKRRPFHCLPSTSCYSQKFLPNKIKKFGWLDVQGSIRDVYIGRFDFWWPLQPF